MSSNTPTDPPAGVCCVPDCSKYAREWWLPSVCALADVEVGWLGVCTHHDLQLNELTVRLLFGDAHDDTLRRYREQQELIDKAHNAGVNVIYLYG